MTENIEEIPLSIERILAAILISVPEVEIPIDVLLGDFSEYQLAVDQRNDDSLVFRFVRTIEGEVVEDAVSE